MHVNVALQMPPDFATEQARWRAVLARDARARGAFVYGVATTGVVCQPACASRRPRRENVEFFDSLAQAERSGYRPCKRCHAGARSSSGTGAVARACRLLASDEAPSSRAVAQAVGLDPTSLVRAFRAKLGITPEQYRRRVRAARARQALRSSKTVSEAVFAAGYGASSRFYDATAKELGMTARSARRGGANERLHFVSAPTSLGTLGVAWTDRGVADVFFVDSAADVAKQLAARWPRATLEAAPPPKWLRPLLASVERPADVELPLDVRGTAFQERVWQAVRRIPLGETRSYTQVARAMGKPGSVRAVARAIASNRLALLVPCHRVVGKDGALTGYRWGVERKRELLRRERSRTPPR